MDYTKTPVQEIESDLLKRAGVRLLVKREDLNHSYISGNKWWKLKYNIQQARSEKLDTVLTFGGAYSNHIYATAAAAYENGFKSIGIIRGEETLPLNATLSFAKTRGMKLRYVSRTQYRTKDLPEFHDMLREAYGDFYMIPEGGSNNLAVRGCAEFAMQELSSIDFDYLCLPVGTGGTMAGLISGYEGRKEIIGIAVLRNAEFLSDEIKKFVRDYSGKSYDSWRVLTTYHHGGYAKVTKPLLEFISSMKDLHDLPLDQVYTGKLLWAVLKEVERGSFPRGSTVLALHTGGLQGAGLL